MYGAFDVVLYFVIIQLFWLLINLLLILSYLNCQSIQQDITTVMPRNTSGDIYVGIGCHNTSCSTHTTMFPVLKNVQSYGIMPNSIVVENK